MVRGYAVIFNHDTFISNEEDRVGTEYDVLALKNVFTKLEIYYEVYTNCPISKIIENVDKLRNFDFKDYSYLAVIILTHGDSGNILCAYDHKYNLILNVVNPIVDYNASLAEKPKLFIVQACKGNNSQYLHYKKNVDATMSSSKIAIPSKMNIFIAFSTYEGFTSARRNDGLGGQFIQSLCNNISEYCSTDNIEGIMRRVIKELSKTIQQVPMFVSTLSEEFFFSKDMTTPPAIGIDIVKKQVIQYFNELMWQRIGSVKEFLPIDNIESVHSEALQSSIEMFISKAIKSNEEMFKYHFDDLEEILQSQLKIYLIQNESKKAAVPAIQDKEPTTSIAIGIDFGTTNTRVAVYHNEKVELIENDNGNFFTPSFVAFTIEERLIGDTAKNQVALNPCNTFFDLKRFVGRKFDDFIDSLNKNHLPFEITKYDEKLIITAKYKNGKEVFMPEEIIAMLLTKMKDSAEKYLSTIILNAVITVPANFNNSQRQSILDGAKIAGLNVLRLLNEPTAAAITFGIDKKIEEKRNILVYDLGGGKLDVSIITIENGIYKVKSTVGNTHFGGNDFDNRMVDHFAKEFTNKHGHDLSSDKRALQRLKSACEKAKRILSGSIHATINIDPLFNGIDYCLKITRSLFEELNDDLFHKTIEFIKDALCYAKIYKSEIDDVILVGGSSRIPKIQKLVQEFFDGKKLNKTINADEAVVSGAAIQASILNGNLSEKIKNIRIQDVTPLSLATEMKNNLPSLLFENNSKIPKSDLKLYHFNSNNEGKFFFYIFEFNDNKKNLLGKFTLSEIPQGIRWPTLVGVTYSINENGIFQLSAFVKSSGKNIKVTTEENINENDIKRMIYDAKKYRAEDVRRKN